MSTDTNDGEAERYGHEGWRMLLRAQEARQWRRRCLGWIGLVVSTIWFAVWKLGDLL